MKKILLIPVLLVSSLVGFAQGSNGLVGHWNFNGNANDNSGHNLNGVVNGAQPSPGYNNIPNTAYRFSGFNPSNSIYHNILIPYDTLINVKQYSICTVVQIDSFLNLPCQTGSIFWRGTQGEPGYYALYYNDNAFDNSCNTHTPGKINVLGDLADAAWMLPNSSRGYNTYSSTGQWYCIANTYDGDTIKLYIDGVLKSKVAFTYNMQKSAEPIRIGASYGFSAQPTYSSNLPYPMYGSIDDARFYRRALSVQELTLYCDSVKLKPGDDPTDTGDTITHPPLQIGKTEIAQPIVVPNPAQDEINVLFQTMDGNGYVQLINAMGQVLAQQSISGEKMRFNLDGYAQGMYMLRIQYKEQLIFEKFLKQ